MFRRSNSGEVFLLQRETNYKKNAIPFFNKHHEYGKLQISKRNSQHIVDQ